MPSGQKRDLTYSAAPRLFHGVMPVDVSNLPETQLTTFTHVKLRLYFLI